MEHWSGIRAQTHKHTAPYEYLVWIHKQWLKVVVNKLEKTGYGTVEAYSKISRY